MSELLTDTDFIEKVVIRLDNTKPVEVMDFLNSVQGFHNQYKKIVRQEGRKYSEEDVKLYISVREGSLEWEFVRIITIKALKRPAEFIYDKLLHKTWEKITSIFNKVQKEEVLEEDLEDVVNAQKCLQPTKNDLSSSLIFAYENKEEKVALRHEISGASGRGIYDKIGELIDKVRLPIKADFENEIAKLVLNEAHVIKCKIESFSEKEVTIICADELKQKLIIENEKNPFSTYYVVNGKVKTVDGKIIAYEIVELVDIIKDEE